MTTCVVEVNRERGMVAVLTEDGDCSIFEMLGDRPPEVGDEIRWLGSAPLGGKTVINVTKRVAYDVCFHTNCVPKGQLRRHVLLQ